MKKIAFIACAALASGLYSCGDKNGNEEIPSGKDPVEFSAAASAAAMTGTGGFDVKWNTGDAIGLFDDVKASAIKKFTLESGAGQASASFKGELEDDDAAARNIYAVSPFDATVKNATANTYPLAISNNQTSMNKYLFTAASTSISKSPSEADVVLNFKHLTAVLKINITNIASTGSSLNAVRLQTKDESAFFATKAKVDLTSATPAATDLSDKVAGINVTVPSGVTDSYEAGFVLFPMDFSALAKDLEVVVLLDNGNTFTYELSGFNKNLAAGTAVSESIELLEYGTGGFEFAAGETARPGVGDFANMDIVPIRGEVLTSASDLTPYTFTLGRASGNGRQLRIWWISKKETSIGLYFALNRFGENNDVMGFDPAHIVAMGGAESAFAGGSASKSWKEYTHFFLNKEDAEKYNVSYSLYNLNHNSKFTAPATESFTIKGVLGNTAVAEANRDNMIPYEDIEFPVAIYTEEDTSGLEVFTPAAGETARPGVGDFADYDVIAIRGEFINSNQGTDNSLYYPASNTTFPTGKGFRMWFIAKKSYDGGKQLKLRHDNGATYFKGTKVSEVTAICGDGSKIGGGNAVRGYNETMGTFASAADNDLYTISYIRWNVDPCIITGAAGDYVVPFYVTIDGVTNAIPKDLVCNVKIKVVAAE